MGRKKLKKRIKEDPRILQARHKRDYIGRLKMVSDQLVGRGWFEKIPPVDVDIIYEKRYPALSIKVAPGEHIVEERWERYRHAFLLLLDNTSVMTDSGGAIPLKTMLCEGLSLLHFIDMMATDRFAGSEELRQIFKPYLLTEKGRYYEAADELSFLLFLLDVRNGNYHEGFLLADAEQTNIGKVPLKLNTVFLHQFKPVVSSIAINGRKREILPVSRPAPFDQTLQVLIKPSDIGFKTVTDEQLPLYIQRHALLRLDERLGLQPDVVHAHLFFELFNQPVTYAKGTDHSLIGFSLHDHKVGYLLTTLHDDKLVIRSFLFLTNDGTPESRKLRQLTLLEKYDKKYLGIDKLSTFTAYHIGEDEKLSALFREAGCGSLLEADSLEVISTAYTPDRNKMELHRYLNSSSYFESL